MNQPKFERTQAINALCNTAKTLVKAQRFGECEQQLCDAMRKLPHSPVPHNLMGIVLEKQGRHADAMKHFRAAYALDPTYSPARHNLEYYGTFYQKGGCAYDEQDCEADAWGRYDIQYDEHGIGRAVRRE